MANIDMGAARQVIGQHIVNARHIPVVSNVRCVRLYRRNYGFGLNFKYSYRTNTIMEEREKRGYENVEDDDDISGSDADVSNESSDTSSNKDEDDTVEKVFIKWLAPGGPADQAGLMEGDEVISVNNSAVYGKQPSDIDSLLQRCTAIDVDVVEDPTKRKGKQFQRYRGNGYEVHVLRRGSQDDLSGHESSDNDSTNTRDRYFVVTYGKASESIDNKSKIHPFLRPTSYSDDEPLMENKSVGILANEDVSTKGNKVSGKKIGLTSLTSSSVLVESRNPKPDITITTAIYSTLAEPQSARTDVSTERLENNSCGGNGLVVPQENGNVLELKVPQAIHIRPRSPSPANRRVSYLMATEGNESLSTGSWEFRSIANGDTTDDALSAFDEENVFQGENEKEKRRPIARFDSLDDDDDYEDNQTEHNLVVEEQKRQSLKRKCSADSVDVDKEGYLKRKYAATHGRRSWKEVYVVLKAHIMYIHKEKPYQMISSGQDEKPISIKSCIVDIAYDYRKRENVFKLTTYNASQYLFQAKDKDEMMSWIKIIQKNNNPDEDPQGRALKDTQNLRYETFGRTSEDLIVRQKKNMDIEISSQTSHKVVPPTPLKIGGLKKSLSFKTNSGSQSSKIKKAIEGYSGKPTWHSKVVSKVRTRGNPTSAPVPQYQAQGFSAVTSLERCPKSKANSSLPLLVEHCCNVVESRALESVGIYRVPGNNAMVTALEEELNAKTPDDINFDEPKWNDANNMASLLRNFLRKLPEGLVTSALYAKFINANRIEGEERMWSLKRLIQQLPPAYGETLRFVIRHLKKVSEHSDKNKMEVRNLAIVFGPTVVRTGEDNMSTMVTDMTDRFRIVESFINHFDWFFDNESVVNGDRASSPVSPPVEVSSPLLVSSNTMNSIEQAAVNFESDPPWRNKGGSKKLPTFKNFLKTQSSESSKSPESSKKQDLSADRRTSQEPVNGKTSPTHLFPRFGGSSQPGSPSTSRRKFMKRHHSSTNISMTETLDDYDRSKSEGEEDEQPFHPRPSHSTKAYSYARPPPPSYRESRSKGRTPVGTNTQLPSNKDITSSETADFNSLTDETKRRLLSFTLRSKVNEKKKQQMEENTPPATQNGVVENVPKEPVSVTVFRKLSNSSQAASSGSTSDEQVVVTEPQLSPREAVKRFEQRSDSTETTSEPSTGKTVSSEFVRRRDGSTSSSSSRNFKIYSKGDVTFSHCQPHQINEWMKDLAMSPKGTNERGRTRAKTEDLSKTLRRCSSVARTSFTQDDDEVIMKRRSLSCQDINLGDEDVLTRERSLSKSSDSSQSSDEEDDPIEASSAAFDEKLRGLMQKCKLDSKSKTELQPVRKTSQLSRPPGYRVNRTPVEKMRDIDPSSNIQTGAVSSMKSLFESGAAHQQVAKSRSSSLSSASSGSILSNDTRRKSTSSNVSDADVKRRVWESGDAKPGETKRQWKEPEWVARERAMKNLHSGSESSMKDQLDDNNNLPNGIESKSQYSRSTSLPIKDSGYVIRDVTVEQKSPVVKCKVVRKFSTDKLKSSAESPTIERAAVKNGPMIRKVTPVSAVQYKLESEKRPPVSHLNYKSDFKTQYENVSGPVLPVQHEHMSKSQAGSLSSVQYKEESKTEKNCSRDKPNKPPVRMIVGRTQSSPLRSRISSQETSPPTSPPFVNSSTSDSSIYPTSPPFSSLPNQRSTRPRRRIVSDTARQAHPEMRQTGRTFTAPILGTIVTTTNAIELSGFAIKPESINRNPRARVTRRSERQDSGGSQGGHSRISNDMRMSPDNIKPPTLAIPKTSSPANYGSPSIRRKAMGLTVPESDDSKRLSTDRTLLEQNALHIKELLDEMNTEHSLKMERQKSDTISIDAQKAARNRARVRRHSLGQDIENRENRVVVASHVSPEVLKERHRTESRNVSIVEWVGVSG